MEFNKRANPRLTQDVTEELLADLFEELRDQFRRTYGLPIRRSCMVDLDSSTSKKFSRHWILHLPRGALFADARAAGTFVRGLVARLDRERASGALRARGRAALADHLRVRAEGASGAEEDGDGAAAAASTTRFIDLGV